MGAFPGEVTSEKAVALVEAQRHHLGGVLLVLLSAVTYGFLPVLAKLVYNSGTNVYTFLALRFSIGGILLWGWVLLRGYPIPRGRLLGAAIILGAVGYTLQSLLFFTAIRYGDVAIIASLAYTYPVFVMLLAAATGRDRLTALKVSALFSAVVGAVLVVGTGGHAQTIGIALVAITNVVYAVYFTICDRVIPAGYATTTATVIISSAGVSYWLLVLFGTHLHAPGTRLGWVALVAAIAGPTLIGVTALLAGLQRLKPVATATVAAAEPVVSVLLSVLLLNESVSPLQVAGLALVVLAVVVVARSSRPTAEVLEARAQR